MLRFRFAPLRAAALLAAAFVGFRVLYRVAFGGASGGGLLLLDLPRLPLGGPFQHIALFGPVTTGGLADAALSALPVALVILGFGVLNALVDVRRFFARGADRGPLRALSRSLVIAWATFPALIESVRRVRTAGALRGERSTPSLLVPVFEQTVERALCLAASMEVRGFAATRAAPAVCARPVVMTDAALGFEGPGGDEHAWHLEALTLDLAPGTLTVIVGSTGSGKTSLLHSMSGLFQHFDDGRQHGSIEVGGADRAATPPRETAGFVGLVTQNVRLSFVAETVQDEIGFALAVRGVAPLIVEQRVHEVAELLQIAHLLGRGTEALSAGEASLVAIGAALINRPILLLVDEPLADLDTPARERVVRVLERLAHQDRVCVVVAEHNTREWVGAADAWLGLRGARVHAVGPGERPGAPAGVETAALPGRSTVILAAAAAAGPLASIRHLTVLHGTERVVDDVSLDLWAGDLVALAGRNGAGKSSLLRAIALSAVRGSVTVAGRDVAELRPRDRRTAVALVPENFDDLLFAVTVAEECRRADRRLTAGTAARFATLLGLGSVLEAAHLMRRHPRDLSAGERLCLVMAIQLAAEPRVLLVDEPTRGLDPGARMLVAAALLRASNAATAVIFATHDRDFARSLATRTVVLAAGRLQAEPEPVRR